MSAKLFSLVAALMFIAVAAQAQQYVTSGLVAFWTLDRADVDGDKVKDVSGNGNDATIMGSLDSEEGVINEALSFNGAGNYVQIPAMGNFEEASVECWAYTRDLSISYQGIISTWQWTGGKVHFKFESSQIQVDKNDGVKLTAPAAVETWFHIIYTDDTTSNELKLYVDGEFIAEGSGGATPENMNERRMGSEHDGRFLNGILDEVRIYNRALDEDEVAQNFEVSGRNMAVAPAGKLATTWSNIKISQ